MLDQCRSEVAFQTSDDGVLKHRAAGAGQRYRDRVGFMQWLMKYSDPLLQKKH